MKNIELHLGNTTKKITSLSFHSVKVMNERALSFNLLRKFVGCLKHITIHMNEDYDGFDQFFKETRILGFTGFTLKFLCQFSSTLTASDTSHFTLIQFWINQMKP